MPRRGGRSDPRGSTAHLLDSGRLDLFCGTIDNGRVHVRVRGTQCCVEWKRGPYWWRTEWVGWCPRSVRLAFYERQKIMAFVKKTMDDGKGVGLPNFMLDKTCSVLSQMPALHEYLTLDRFDDGSPRERSNLLIFCEDGVIKCCLNDRANGCSLWRSGHDLLDVLTGMDGTLQKGTSDWRGARKSPAKRK